MDYDCPNGIFSLQKVCTVFFLSFWTTLFLRAIAPHMTKISINFDLSNLNDQRAVPVHASPQTEWVYKQILMLPKPIEQLWINNFVLFIWHPFLCMYHQVLRLSNNQGKKVKCAVSSSLLTHLAPSQWIVKKRFTKAAFEPQISDVKFLHENQIMKCFFKEFSCNKLVGLMPINNMKWSELWQSGSSSSPLFHINLLIRLIAGKSIKIFPKCEFYH